VERKENNSHSSRKRFNKFVIKSMIMPFIYRGEPVNINRSKKRSDEFIHENMTKTVDDIFHDSGSGYIKILPISSNDPPFDKANPKEFLTIHAIKDFGLSWFDVEHWLDFIAELNGYYFNKTSRAYVDERRRYYRQPSKKIRFGNPKTEGGFISNHLIYPRKLL